MNWKLRCHYDGPLKFCVVQLYIIVGILSRCGRTQYNKLSFQYNRSIFNSMKIMHFVETLTESLSFIKWTRSGSGFHHHYHHNHRYHQTLLAAAHLIGVSKCTAWSRSNISTSACKTAPRARRETQTHISPRTHLSHKLTNNSDLYSAHSSQISHTCEYHGWTCVWFSSAPFAALPFSSRFERRRCQNRECIIITCCSTNVYTLHICARILCWV